MGNELSSQDADLLRASFEVALQAVAAGNHPFGAILANKERQILLEAENTVATGDDITGHAETNLVRRVGKESYGAALESCTLYASSEPCAMCSGAIYWASIGRVVYGLSQERFYSIVGGVREQQALTLHCRDVLGRGGRPVEIIGPALEDEAAQVHAGFWY